MSPQEIDELALLLHEKLRANREAYWIEPETHAEQHTFISEWIERKKQRHQSWMRIKESVIGWLIIGLIGGVLSAIGIGVFQFLKSRLG